MKYFCTIICLFLFSFNLFSENRLDSLKQSLENSANDSVNVLLLLATGDEFEYSNPDSAIFYYNKALDICQNHIKNSDSIFEFKLLIAQVYNYLAIVYQNRGEYPIAKNYYLKMLEINLNFKNDRNIALAYLNIGSVFIDMGNHELAIEYILKSLKIKEKNNDKSGMSYCYANLALIFDDLNQFEKAIDYYEKSNDIEKELNNSKGLADNYLNIGTTYQKILLYEKSVSSYFIALNYYEDSKDQFGISACYLNLGVVYKYLKDYKRSLGYYLKALEINENIEDFLGMTECYLNIAGLYNIMNDFKISIVYSEKALVLANKYNYVSSKVDIYKNLSESYEYIGNSDNSLQYYKLYSQFKDSVMNSEKFKLISEMESKYENEKHQLKIETLEKEKELQKSEIEKQDEKVKKQNAIIISFVVVFILIIISLIIIYRLLSAKKKAFNLLEIQNVEINQKNEEISIQRDLVIKQKNYIENIHNEVTDSIYYARRIQRAVLPDSNLIKILIPNSFILYRPKNIVSGDFYWISKRKDWTIVAVADCTGHGVPGAFMSMLGISFLNEIVAREEIVTSSAVLNALRSCIISALNQKGIQGEQKDGMDISLIAIKPKIQRLKSQASNEEQTNSHFEKRCTEPVEVVARGIDDSSIRIESYPSAVQNSKLSILDSTLNSKNEILNEKELMLNNEVFSFNAQWAGANNPLWIVRNAENLKGFQNLLGLEELKPDKMPIAIYERMDDFTNHEIEIYKGDMIYLMSDGYQDQFGGPDNKKYKSKQLKQLILNNSNLSMNEQKEVLEKTLSHWIGDMEQIDDITILGLKI